MNARNWPLVDWPVEEAKEFGLAAFFCKFRHFLIIIIGGKPRRLCSGMRLKRRTGEWR
jgi:hypothetical protein